MNKPKMMLKWADEPEGRAISRDDAARNIRQNRRVGAKLGVKVLRKHGETFIASKALGVACCIYRAT